MKLDMDWKSELILTYKIDSDQGSCNQNRVFDGLNVSLNEHINGAVYCMWQSIDKDTFWDDAHILGFSAIFVFSS